MLKPLLQQISGVLVFQTDFNSSGPLCLSAVAFCENAASNMKNTNDVEVSGGDCANFICDSTDSGLEQNSRSSNGLLTSSSSVRFYVAAVNLTKTHLSHITPQYPKNKKLHFG